MNILQQKWKLFLQKWQTLTFKCNVLSTFVDTIYKLNYQALYLKKNYLISQFGWKRLQLWFNKHLVFGTQKLDLSVVGRRGCSRPPLIKPSASSWRVTPPWWWIVPWWCSHGSTAHSLSWSTTRKINLNLSVYWILDFTE